MDRLALVTMITVLTAFPAAALAEHHPCAPFDKLALKRLPQTVDPDSTVRMQDVWDKWSRKIDGGSWPLTTGAEPQFRIETSQTFVSKPHAYEIRGVRGGQAWSLQARKKPIKHRHDKWGPWRRVAVTAATANRLDRLVGDTCLWSTPSFLASTLPLVGGGWVPDFDGPVTYIDVRANGRHWAGMQISWMIGVPAELRNTVLNAAFGEPFNHAVPGSEDAFAHPWYKDERGEHAWAEPQGPTKN